MVNMNSYQLFGPLIDCCDIKQKFFSIFLAFKRRDTGFRTRQVEVVDTSTEQLTTEQLTADSLLTPSEY